MFRYPDVNNKIIYDYQNRTDKIPDSEFGRILFLDCPDVIICEYLFPEVNLYRSIFFEDPLHVSIQEFLHSSESLEFSGSRSRPIHPHESKEHLHRKLFPQENG